MYSLYRAWLTLGPPCPLGPLPPPTGPPDITLQVGPTMTQFSAHRAVLSTHSGFFKAALLNQPDNTPIAVPNVNVDEFSSLLTFMYTGYLDLNLTNIYNILLATHILHMPRALEICRSFLLHSQSNHLVEPLLSTPSSIIKPIASRKQPSPTQQIFPPTFTHLQKSELTPFRSVINKASTSQEEKKIEKTTATVTTTTTTTKRNPTMKKKNNGGETSSGEKVIIDIACCDGPVRFHRVINKNYGNHDIIERNLNMNDRNAALNKVMNENIQQMSDENQNNGEMFTCIYCNHTFKSQYCYQKHARRHLHPVSLDTKNVAIAATSTTTIQKETPTTTTTAKREVKLLDMNVQYYPCKTCGSKFPSYYFVHKHRKLCHAEEMADNTNKNNEIVPENNSSNSAIDVESDM